MRGSRASPQRYRDTVVRRSSRTRDVTARRRVARRPPRPAARWRRCPLAETPPLQKTHTAIGHLLGQSARQARSRDLARLLSNNQRGRACSPARWAGSGHRLVFGAVTQRSSGRFWLSVGIRRCQSAWWAGAGCDAEEWRARVGGGCGGRVALAFQVGFAVRAVLCCRLRPWRPRERCTE